MKSNPRNLAATLSKGLAPIYLLSGDEPLQMMECGDLLRRVAREQGFGERQVLQVETGFDWSSLMGEAASMSLFAERKLIELRMPSGKPGREGAKALRAYASQPPQDNLLVIHSGKLDRSARASAWVKALEKAGVWVEIWDLKPAETLKLVGERLRQAGFQPDQAALRLLTERVEGNLLAAVQEIEKLKLVRSPGPLSAKDIVQAVADSARYDPFELADSALMGDSHRVIRILKGLQGEGVHEAQILWAISRDLRMLADYSALAEAGHNPESALRGVWGQRKNLVLRAARRYPASGWAGLLRCCVRLDHMIKGLEQGNVWDDLLQLLLKLAGEPVIRLDCEQLTVTA